MKKPDEKFLITEEGFELRFHPRPSATISVRIPIDTLDSWEDVAKSRDMSSEALIKSYIGQGLRQDSAKLSDDPRESETNVAPFVAKRYVRETKIPAIHEKISVDEAA